MGRDAAAGPRLCHGRWPDLSATAMTTDAADARLPALETLAEVLRDAARAELLPRLALVNRRFKHDGGLVTEADTAMQQRIQRELHARWPQYCFLGEEMEAGAQEALVQGETCTRCRGLWVLDPLDGTSNFAAGIPMFAVSLALIVDRRPVLGLVLDPLRDECFMAQVGQGARLNASGVESVLETRGACVPPWHHAIGVVDFKRLPQDLATRLSHRPPFGSQRNFGSVCLEWCWLADGRIHLLLHGGQKLWDFAAGVLILSEAGGLSCTLAGKEVFGMTLSPRSVVAAVNRELFDRCRDWLRGAGDSECPRCATDPAKRRL